MSTEKVDQEKFEAAKFDVQNKLKEAGIDYSNWGQPNSEGKATKKLDDLVKEYMNEECFLIKDKNGLRREVNVGAVNVYYNDKDRGLLVLKEKVQHFKDARPDRPRNLPTSVSEKFAPGGDPKEAALRGLKEELSGLTDQSDLEGELNLVYDGPKVKDEPSSPSFPGLHSIYNTEVFHVELSDNQFDKMGYFENQEEKVSIFEWVPVEPKAE